MTTAIIGGGAAGVAAAIAAAERGQKVLVLERNRKPLKKLGVTGNGRANVLNAGEPIYYGDTAFALAVLGRVGYADLCAFFASLGVPLREETEGRVYPAALQATVVVDALLLRARQLGVEFAVNTRVIGLARDGQGFMIHAVQTDPDRAVCKGGKPALNPAQSPAERACTFRADRVIVTAGGAAAPAQGTDGGGYALLTAFGHRVTPLAPALCALLTDKRRIAGLSGQRVRAGFTLCAADGRVLHRVSGEVLFGDDAVSGIAAMQLARIYQPGASLALDLRPATGWAEGQQEQDTLPVPALTARLRTLATARQDCALADLLTGTFVAPVARLVCREAGLADPGLPIARLTQADLCGLAETIACLRLPVTGTRGFDQAQVTAGGVQTADFDPATMESRLCPGLFAAGEVLNVDGDCGGFNLMFAFASGMLAGRAE